MIVTCMPLNVETYTAQARQQLPVTLVLGLATSLQQMLPAAAADCLQTRHFQLVQVRGRALERPALGSQLHQTSVHAL